MSISSNAFAKRLKNKWRDSADEFEKDMVHILNDLGIDLTPIQESVYSDSEKINLYLFYKIRHTQDEDNQLDAIQNFINRVSIGVQVKKVFFFTNNKGVILGTGTIDILHKALNVQFPKSKISIFDMDSSLFNFFEKEMSDDIIKNIKSTNQEIYREYKEAMEQIFYYDKVPFVLESSNGKSEKRQNPLHLLHEEGRFKSKNLFDTLSVDNGQSPKTEWTFVISEFGFGKTSLLMNLWMKFKEKAVIPILLPIAQMDKTAFQSTTEFCHSALSIILGRKLDRDSASDQIFTQVFKEMMHKRPDFALLLDGLDEHHTAYMHKTQDGKQTGFQRIFSCLTDFIPTLFFSLRKEVWDERYNDIQIAIGKRRNNKKIFLSEWSEQEIVQYTKQYLSHSTEKEKIENFIKIVEQGEYEQFYGDIPKRPLFLNMVIQDIEANNVQSSTISELYEKYISKKYYRDRSGVSGYSNRQLNKNENFVLQELFHFQEDLVGLMFIAKGGEVVQTYSIDEIQVLPLLEQYGFTREEISDVLNHSVLMPLDKRVTNFRLRFAHKSFQDYFFARLIFRIFQNEDLNTAQLLYDTVVTTEVINFLDSITKSYGQPTNDDTLELVNWLKTNKNTTLKKYIDNKKRKMTPESLKEENSNIAINTSHFKTTLDNMKTVSLQAHLKQLVINAKEKKALDVLYDWTSQNDADLNSQIVLLLGRYNRLQKDINGDLIESSDSRVDIARIVSSLKNIMDELPNNATIRVEEKQFESASPTVRDTSTPVVNKVEVMKILFIAANPNDTSRLATDTEHRIIKAEMERGSHRDKFTFLPPQFAVTIAELLRAMNDQPHIVHFSGHGVERGIVISTDNNETQILPTPAISRLFRPLKDVTKVVLLNACYSAGQAEEISKLGCYVVGYQKPIGDKAAIGFAQGLYNGLGEGKDFAAAYNDAMIVLWTVGAQYAEIVEVWKDGKKQVL